MNSLDEYLTTEEVAAHYRISVRTVEKWRHRSVGPRWVRVGRRALYPLDGIRQYDRQRKAAS